jgi:hypothetical protein
MSDIQLMKLNYGKQGVMNKRSVVERPLSIIIYLGGSKK